MLETASSKSMAIRNFLGKKHPPGFSDGESGFSVKNFRAKSVGQLTTLLRGKARWMRNLTNCLQRLRERLETSLRSRRGGESTSEIGIYVPVPSSSMTCGLVEALSIISTVPCFVPCFVGENRTLIVQLEPDATLAPHVDRTPNSGLAFIDLISRGLPPVLVRVTVRALLVAPTASSPK